MKKTIGLIIFMLCFIVSQSVSLEAEEAIPFKVYPLSPKSLIIGTKTGNSKCLVLDTQKGLVVINSFWSPRVVEEAKKIIREKLGDKKIAYLINTCISPLQTGGTEAFAGVERIGHVALKQILEKRQEHLPELLKSRAREFQQRVDRTTRQLKEVEPGSKREKALAYWLQYCKRLRDDLNKGYKLLLPTITYNEHMSLDMGDMTVELLYFGKADKDGDTLIRVKEENLLFLGDVFHAGHVLPYGQYTRGFPDIEHWMGTLEQLLEDKDKIKYVDRSNGVGTWTVKDVEGRYRLIRDIRDKVKIADGKGLNLAQLEQELSDLKKEFPYVLTWNVPYPDVVKSDILILARGLWKMTHKSAVELLEKAYGASGIEGAKAEYARLKGSAAKEVYFRANEFNMLGYRVLGKKKYADAVEMFKLALKHYPDSSNLYDSLGEAYMKKGDNKNAIENYRRSLELNQNNENARKVLKQLEKKSYSPK